MTAKLIISYDGTSKDRFDRDYYCNKHIPQVRKIWEPLGLIDIRPFFPGMESNKNGTLCICHCEFRDKTALETAFANPATKMLIDDISNFTDMAMDAYILFPLEACSKE